MKYLIDTADLEAIKAIDASYPVTGVTTNPSILAKAKAPARARLQAIREAMGSREVHVQTLGLTAGRIVEEAKAICELLGPETYIKVPVNPEGIKAIQVLKEAGHSVTATAICSAQQGLMAAVAGADYVVPYVNRIAELNVDAIALVAELASFLASQQLPTEILLASLKHSQQIHEALLAGATAMTLPPELFSALATHARSESSIAAFIADWEAAGLSLFRDDEA